MKTNVPLLTNKRLMLVAVLIMLAVILLCFSIMEPKHKEDGEWLPLNEAVADSLSEMESIADQTIKPGQQASAAPALPDQQTKSVSLTDGTVEAVEADTHTDSDTENMAHPSVSSEPGKLDINLATAAELDDLKGIGPAKAQAIVADREQNGKFSSVHDLLRVKGIGEKLLQAVEDSIVARP
ncbi:ComEA family DNA-binding protein [Paenibacillus sinopodophylli]|uniref:ComEA family DNA-binding protein n=1 Tax=Paenibacillus sinopodophylli TaxID=1837342 RepID=UPI001BB1F893|nr:helix-hairpin-helix domain-containing protein [Paenibacillus sinopodophylli]